MLHIASYNIQKALGHDMRRRPDRTLGVLAEMDADVVILQEADRRFGRRASAIPPGAIRDETPYLVVPLAIRPDSIGWHGNAILVRRGIEIIKHRRLDLPYLEPRGAVMAEVVTPRGAIIVAGAHLALARRWRRQQARALSRLADEEHLPLIVGGDFNEWAAAGRGLAPLAGGLREHAPGATFPAFRPIAALDRFYVRGDLRLEAEVHDTPLARKASDHLPIRAEVTRGDA